MNLEHVYVSTLMGIVMYSVCGICVHIAMQLDDFSMPNGWVGGKKYVMCAMLACILAESVWSSMGIGVILGGLLFACITDNQQCQVYHFVWWIIGGVLFSWILFAMWNHVPIPWSEIIVYCLIQEVFFSKLYGKADCHAFSACAMVLALQGYGIWYYLLHMIYAVILLTVIQFHNKNILLNGKLKKPVPFMPYIVLSFIVLCAVIA